MENIAEHWKQQYYDLLSMSELMLNHREGTKLHEFARKKISEVLEEEDSTE
jgi:hypothetical protein